MKKEKLVVVFVMILGLLSCSKDNVEDTKKPEKEVVDNNDDDDDDDDDDGGDNGGNDNNKESLFKIYKTNNVASYKMTEGSYKKWKDNYEFGNQQALKSITKEIYKEFKDDFDFIFLVLNERRKPENFNAYGELKFVSNNIQNTGIPVYNFCEEYGSKGKLKSVMQLSALPYLKTGPALHEIMHTWGNYLIPAKYVSPGQNGKLKVSDNLPHWGFVGGSSLGQLGGFNQSTLQQNTDGSYTTPKFGMNANKGNAVVYNDLELYLMGMIDLSEVRPFDVFTSIDESTFKYDRNNRTFTFNGNKKTYTSQTILEEFGNRNPSYEDSQKEFKALVLVLTDRDLTEEEWKIISTDTKDFSKPWQKGDSESYNKGFSEATRGKGTFITADLDESLIK